MLQRQLRKYRVWRVKQAYKKRMELQMKGLAQILDLIAVAHEKYLIIERKEKEPLEIAYWKGRWEGLRDLFCQ